MYYGKGNYEAFARPRKPARADNASAYIVGAGLAGLAAAVFLIRDAQVPGARIHVFEELPLAGGSLDGAKRAHAGFVTRGGREMEDHFECLWDMYRSIPSLEIEGASYLDEYYWLDKDDPNSSNCRLIHNLGERVSTDGKFTLTEQAQSEIAKLIAKTESSLDDQTIEDYFSEDFFESNFWFYWSTMFAFERWHSLIEMRRYLMRFIHHIDGLPDFTALKFNRYNQYESMVKPLLAYLEAAGVDFRYGTTVQDVVVDADADRKVATRLLLTVDGTPEEIALSEDDLVFITNGSITESSTYGDHHTPAPPTDELGGSWTLWQNLAKQSPEFGHPEVFCENLPARSWFISATATIENTQVDPYIERLTKRDLHDHKVNTGGIITVTDSSWLLSFAVHRQPHFKEQQPNETTVWIYGLYSDTEGDLVHKKITECTGEEITQEWLYHLGVPEVLIPELARQESINTVPVYMPFITSYFMPRTAGDRPAVVPNGSKNLAFIGNFAESPTRDTVFTTEYSVRTAMEAVYTLLDVERAVPEVFGSVYDIRELLKAVYYLRDQQNLEEAPVHTTFPVPHFLLNIARDKIRDTWPEELLRDAGLL